MGEGTPPSRAIRSSAPSHRVFAATTRCAWPDRTTIGCISVTESVCPLAVAISTIGAASGPAVPRNKRRLELAPREVEAPLASQRDRDCGELEIGRGLHHLAELLIGGDGPPEGFQTRKRHCGMVPQRRGGRYGSMPAISTSVS